MLKNFILTLGCISSLMAAQDDMPVNHSFSYSISYGCPGERYPQTNINIKFTKLHERKNSDALQKAFVLTLSRALRESESSQPWAHVSCLTYPTDIDIIEVLQRVGFKASYVINGVQTSRTVWRLKCQMLSFE